MVDAAVVVSDGVLCAAAAAAASVDLVDLLAGVVVALALVGFVASPGQVKTRNDHHPSYDLQSR